MYREDYVYTVLMERYNIRFPRTHYLRDIKRLQQEGKPIGDMDESYIYAK